MADLIGISPKTNLFQRRLGLFPDGTALSGDPPVLTIAGQRLDDLAETYGTPLYLYDQATMSAALNEYRKALIDHYPAESAITYAGKAFLCLAMAQWTAREGLQLDCTGAGELHVAAAAGVPPAQIVVHGVNKSPEDLDAALGRAGTIVVDNLTELDRLNTAYQIKSALNYGQDAGAGLESGRFPDLWLRLRPGEAVDTHAYTQTGQADSKFGLGWPQARHAVRQCLENNLPLNGVHFHLGSQFRDSSPLERAIESTLDFLAACRDSKGWEVRHLCVGGGWGAAYHEDDLPHPPVEDYITVVASQIVQGCLARGLDLPKLHIEPGRSLAARAGVAVYRVGTVKESPGRRWILLDGGMADNIRPALYGARYSALPVLSAERPADGNYWLAGPYCESGDVLIQDLALPALAQGEWVAVPVSGAYQLSMGSNYNGARKPAVLWLNAAGAQLIQERQSLDGLLRRDKPLPA